MAKKGKKSKKLCHKDRLSDLDDDTIYGILSFLPLADAVRTSILSKRFRSCWKGIRVVKFDKQTCADFFKGKKIHQFNDVVRSVLPSLIGPVHQFELYLPLAVTRTQRMMPALLPSHVHNSNYIKLTFSNCQLTSPQIYMCGFSKLLSLRLFYVHADGIQLEALISKARQLKSLVVAGLQTVGTNGLVVDAQELKTLEYRSSKTSLRLKYLPNLTSAIIRSKVELAACDCQGSSFLQLFSLLPKVQELNLSYIAVKSLIGKKVPENVPIKSVIRPEMQSCALSLIRSSLNLKSLDFYTLGAHFHACPDTEVELEFNEAKLLATIEASCVASLSAGKYNEALECIRVIAKAAITIREKRNHTQP